MFIEFPDTICYLREDSSASVQVLPGWQREGTT